MPAPHVALWKKKKKKEVQTRKTKKKEKGKRKVQGRSRFTLLKKIMRKLRAAAWTRQDEFAPGEQVLLH